MHVKGSPPKAIKNNMAGLSFCALNNFSSNWHIESCLSKLKSSSKRCCTYVRSFLIHGLHLLECGSWMIVQGQHLSTAASSVKAQSFSLLGTAELRHPGDLAILVDTAIAVDP